MTQTAVKPRIGRRSFWPGSVIQPGKNDEIGALNTGLQSSPDHDMRVGFVRCANFFLRQNTMYELAVIMR